MPSAARSAPLAVATTTRTSVKTILAVGVIGAASFAAAFFAVSMQSTELILGVTPNVQDIQASEGDANVTTLDFSMAAKGQAVSVSSLTFNVIGELDGDFSSIQNDLVATDYVTTCLLQKNGASLSVATPIVNGQLAFTGLAINMPKGRNADFQITCDLANPVTPHANAYGLALSIPSDTQVVAAEASTGTVLTTGQIIVDHNDAGVNVAPLQELYINEFSTSLALTRSVTPGDVTAVDGQTSVAVLGIDATATGLDDATLTGLTLTAYGDNDGVGAATIGGELSSDVNDYVISCSLYDGAALVAGPVPPDATGQMLVFTNFQTPIPVNTTKTLTVKCDFANTAPLGNVYFSFDVNDVTTDVIAEDESGDALTSSQLSGSDLNGGTTLSSANVVTLQDSGYLAVSESPITPAADFLLTSSLDTTVSVFRFTATAEDFNVNTLSISEEQAEDDTGTVDSSSYTNNISTVKIEYLNASGSTVSKTGFMSGNEAKFTGLDMYVAAGVPQDVSVKVSVPASDRMVGGSATSDEKVRLGLFVDTTNDDNFKAVGASSGTTFDDDDRLPLGDDQTSVDGIATWVIRATKPTVALSAVSPAGAAVVGRNEVLRFDVSANTNGPVVINQLTFQATLTDNNGNDPVDWNDCDTDDPALAIDPSDFDLYNLTDSGLAVTLDLSTSDVHNTTLLQMSAGTNNPWTLLTADGNMCTPTTAKMGFVHLTLPSSLVIPAGQTKTLALYFDSTGASAVTDDQVRFDLPIDPLAGSYLNVADASNMVGLAATSTTLTVDNGANFAGGDVIVLDAGDNGADANDEHLLVTDVNANTLTVVRGYLGTNLTPSAFVGTSDDIARLPGAFLWKDDGVSGPTGSADDFWGAYLVDNLSVRGNDLVF